MKYFWLDEFLYIDALSKIMIFLVCFLGVVIWTFSYRYMDGDKYYRRFLFKLFLLCLSAIVTFAADQVALLFLSWGLSNWLLVNLMIHKPEWKEARQSGLLAAKYFSFSSTFLAAAFCITYLITGHTSLQSIIKYQNADNAFLTIAISFLCLAAMAQSAIYPFHRWLLSSLNSPTPVSAIMHAGLVNGGGYLLVRFSPLYANIPSFLLVIFLLGLITSILGTLWKLMQPDVKRMLACSTMAQMGFMMLQCGLGLFPAAVAHLCWHGLFKAYLFLSSGSAAQEKRLKQIPPLKYSSYIIAVLCGIIGTYVFAVTTGKKWLNLDTSYFLLGVAFIAFTQFSLVLLNEKPYKNMLFSIIFTIIGAFFYGSSIRMIATYLGPLSLNSPQPLNSLHIIGLSFLLFAWLLLNYREYWMKSYHSSKHLRRLYVWGLNASQPHPMTVTNHHNHYTY